MKKIDFDIENIEKQNISLLNCQVDLILRSLEFYSYTYNFIYPRRGKSESLEENLRKSLVRDTYHQITSQIKITNHDSKNENVFDDDKNYFEKIA